MWRVCVCVSPLIGQGPRVRAHVQAKRELQAALEEEERKRVEEAKKQQEERDREREFVRTPLQFSAAAYNEQNSTYNITGIGEDLYETNPEFAMFLESIRAEKMQTTPAPEPEPPAESKGIVSEFDSFLMVATTTSTPVVWRERE